jgi:hypothetical protein
MTTVTKDSEGTSASESTPALEVHGVRKTFEAEIAPVRALRGVDLTVAQRSSRSWDLRDAASRRCSTSSRDWKTRTRARSWSRENH